MYVFESSYLNTNPIFSITYELVRPFLIRVASNLFLTYLPAIDSQRVFSIMFLYFSTVFEIGAETLTTLHNKRLFSKFMKTLKLYSV